MSIFVVFLPSAITVYVTNLTLHIGSSRWWIKVPEGSWRRYEKTGQTGERILASSDGGQYRGHLWHTQVLGGANKGAHHCKYWTGMSKCTVSLDAGKNISKSRQHFNTCGCNREILFEQSN